MSTPHDDSAHGAGEAYLWDRSAPADPEIERLERLLEGYAHRAQLAPATLAGASAASRALARAPRRTAPRTRYMWSLAGAGLLAAAGFALWLAVRALSHGAAPGELASAGASRAPSSEPQPLASLVVPSGAPQVASAPPERVACGAGSGDGAGYTFRTEGGAAQCGGGAWQTGYMPLGGELVTPPAVRATVDIGAFGTLELAPDTRVRAVAAEGSARRLELVRGSVRAKVNAPPRLFIVSTPHAEAVDLGCAYELDVAEDGAGLLHVSFGSVALERAGFAGTLVTQGASCRILKDGPGTPLADAASAPLKSAAGALDGGDLRALEQVIASAGLGDTLTLWHLMRYRDPDHRALAYDRLATLVPPPAAAPREAVVRGERAAISAYRETLEVRWFALPVP